MFDKLDQIFVTALHWLVGFLPEALAAAWCRR